MGISQEAYKLLLDEKKRGHLKGDRLLQLGRQYILFGEEALHRIAKEKGVPLVDTPFEPSFDDYWKRKGSIDDKMLFKSLGFKDVQSIDNSDFEGSEIVLDLNLPIPEEYWNSFDVIVDGGTSEHVFHFPQFLANLHLLLKEGGVIFHNASSNNHVDHGYYMFSPLVFNEYYQVNNYEILTSQIYEYRSNSNRPWGIYTYEPGLLDELSIGCFSKKMLGVNIVVRKTAQSTAGVIPQQGIYAKAWDPKKRSPEKLRKVNPLHRLCISLNKKIKRRFWTYKHFLARRQLSRFKR